MSLADKNNPKTIQETSTAQGRCSILTGVWGIENGVVKHTTKRSDVPTVLMEGAENVTELKKQRIG